MKKQLFFIFFTFLTNSLCISLNSADIPKTTPKIFSVLEIPKKKLNDSCTDLLERGKEIKKTLDEVHTRVHANTTTIRSMSAHHYANPITENYRKQAIIVLINENRKLLDYSKKIAQERRFDAEKVHNETCRYLTKIQSLKQFYTPYWTKKIENHESAKSNLANIQARKAQIESYAKK